LEHLTYTQSVDVVKKVFRILDENGSFLARSPNGDSPLGLRYQNGDPTHISFIGSGSALCLGLECGFDKVEVLPQTNPVVGFGFVEGWGRFIQNALWWLMENGMRILFHPRKHVYYCSKNLVIIMKKESEKCFSVIDCDNR
jgi:hypothetical protein